MTLIANVRTNHLSRSQVSLWLVQARREYSRAAVTLPPFRTGIFPYERLGSRDGNPEQNKSLVITLLKYA